MDKKQYAWGFSENSVFDGYYETIEECLKEARESNDDDEMIVFIGELAEYKSLIDGISILEELQTNAWNDLEEVAENFLEDVSREKIKELEDGLNKVYHEWLTKHHLELGYITETEKYNLETGKIIKSLK